MAGATRQRAQSQQGQPSGMMSSRTIPDSSGRNYFPNVTELQAAILATFTRRTSKGSSGDLRENFLDDFSRLFGNISHDRVLGLFEHRELVVQNRDSGKMTGPVL
jgi:hypothetical protein